MNLGSRLIEGDGGKLFEELRDERPCIRGVSDGALSHTVQKLNERDRTHRQMVGRVTASDRI